VTPYATLGENIFDNLLLTPAGQSFFPLFPAFTRVLVLSMAGVNAGLDAPALGAEERLASMAHSEVHYFNR